MKDVKELKLMTLDDVLSQIKDGMTLGIGTGSTIELLVPKIAELIQQHRYDITGVCTSNKTAFLAKELNIKIIEVNDVKHVDLAIDGADEVDNNLNLIKGGGGALFREKVIDEMAERFVVVVDENKLVDYLGETFVLPVEVDKFNWYQIAKTIESTKSINVNRRVSQDVPFTTDNGNYILDCQLKKGIDPYEMHEFLIHLTGVLETGYFLDVADQVIVGTQDGVKILNKNDR
ncbi:ribose 5-phosphate isomerase A [Staphylococcus saccharolyticus]|uniref:Ribose-5-phosphate isomerase A n=1 Tax=Staphylococcus saccharolyticus TaxID=33028 RepID=A0A380H1I9_9STAP|nr:ribose 5-phosphate isomerase A [Staphylococcus saccharolyticus]MBL7564834.1 ribose 5-phosphate isomerase A [Staphylococcus saccharolyticus]MBL7570902.1 ribose 5-phosphate isomerase A [Staphylococcus saccharolyticus]QQB98762.1 ribose 5-phosphate isomerase A [Staphylococcus saccharolyticus]QRJ67023.1 ribose 5-phosphate isomerase A [Staphylococcus saccharolyticus]RTX99816.1 ribose 5-phosphate isomerase A [Staphylococcus saccharolyticus]